MKISKISRLPLLVKKISLVIGLTVCASMSHAGNCGSGYLIMVGFGVYQGDNDVYLQIDPRLEPISSRRFYDGGLPYPTMRLRQQKMDAQGLHRLNSQKAILQMALAGKLPVYLNSHTDNCANIDQVFVYAHEKAIKGEMQ